MFRMVGLLTLWLIGVGLAFGDKDTAKDQAGAEPAPKHNLAPMQPKPYHRADVTVALTPVQFGDAPTAQPAVQSYDAPAGYVSASAAQTPSSAPAYEVTGNRVNLRAGPSTARPVVAVLERGTQARLLGTHQGWAQVKVIGAQQRGFLSARFLRQMITEN